VSMNKITIISTATNISYVPAMGQEAGFDARVCVGGFYTQARVIRQNRYAYSNYTPQKPFFLTENEELSLALTSLPNFALKKEIPVLVTYHGNGDFCAEIAGIDISIAADSIGDCLKMLKEYVESVYRRYSAKRDALGKGPRRQLEFLEAYIGQERR